MGSWGENGLWVWEAGSEGIMKIAIAEKVAELDGIETEYDSEKMEKKLKEHLKKARKNMEFKATQTLEAAIDEYSDNLMGAIYHAFYDRDWFMTGQVDLLSCMDAGIKDLFPERYLKRVKQEQYEEWCLRAYERSFDEQRFAPILSEVVPNFATGPKTKKKVWAAVEQGRKAALKGRPASVDDFVAGWINNFCKVLCEFWGTPEGYVEHSDMSAMFVSLLESGGLPPSLGEEGATITSDMIEETMQTAYVEQAAAYQKIEEAERKAGKLAAKKAKKQQQQWDEEEEEAPAYGKAGGKGIQVARPFSAYGKGAAAASPYGAKGATAASPYGGKLGPAAGKGAASPNGAVRPPASAVRPAAASIRPVASAIRPNALAGKPLATPYGGKGAAAASPYGGKGAAAASSTAAKGAAGGVARIPRAGVKLGAAWQS